MKQIAGRAGRFGTSYATGQVTTLHGADRDTLRGSLLWPDESIPGAGVFPSREQLEMLGALLDNKVGKNVCVCVYCHSPLFSMQLPITFIATQVIVSLLLCCLLLTAILLDCLCCDVM